MDIYENRHMELYRRFNVPIRGVQKGRLIETLAQNSVEWGTLAVDWVIYGFRAKHWKYFNRLKYFR